MEDINSGWLIKSPGTRYVKILNGRVQIPVKAKWRRRFFRLYRPEGALPDQYKFSYYKDESLSKKLGSINLDSCEQIQASLDSAFYQHLFAVQTGSTGRAKRRLYYLAVDTEEEMSVWVDALCQLCNLHDAPRLSDNHTESLANNISNSPRVGDGAEDDRPLHCEATRSTQDTNHSNNVGREMAPASRPDSYQDISNFTSGAPLRSPVSVKAVSHSLTAHRVSTCESLKSAGSEQSEVDYDFPSSLAVSSDISNQQQVLSPIPKPRNVTTTPMQELSSGRCVRLDGESGLERNQPITVGDWGEGQQSAVATAAIISPLSEALHQLASDINDADDSAPSPEDDYDVPPTPTALASGYRRPDGGSGCVAPPRPPKLTSNESQESADDDTAEADYTNVESVRDSLAAAAKSHLTTNQLAASHVIESLYDVPRSLATAPPPHCLGPNTKIHKYVNASSTRLVSDEAEAELYSEVPRSLQQMVKPAQTLAPSPKNSYLPMDGRSDYTVMDTESASSPTYRHHTEDIYDVAPPSRPLIPKPAEEAGHSHPHPHRPHKPSNLHNPGNTVPPTSDSGIMRISTSFRTKSYVRDSVFSEGEKESSFRVEQLNIKKEIHLPSRVAGKEETSSEDESSESCSEPDGQLEQIYDVPPTPLPMPSSVSVGLQSKTTTPQPARRPSRESSAQHWTGSSPAHHKTGPPTGVRSTATTLPQPAPRFVKTSHDIDYVELEHANTNNSNSSAVRSVSHNRGNMAAPRSSVQYVEIDRVKTEALAAAQAERNRRNIT